MPREPAKGWAFKYILDWYVGSNAHSLIVASEIKCGPDHFQCSVQRYGMLTGLIEQCESRIAAAEQYNDDIRTNARFQYGCSESRR